MEHAIYFGSNAMDSCVKDEEMVMEFDDRRKQGSARFNEIQ